MIKTTFSKHRYSAELAEHSRQPPEETRLISTIIFNTTTENCLKSSRKIGLAKQRLLKLRQRAQQSNSRLCIRVFQVELLMRKRRSGTKKAITHFLAKDMMPINTVSREGFTSLIHKMDRRYRIPSRNFSHVAIPQMYETCRKTVMFELSQAENYTSTTVKFPLQF